MNLQTAYRNFFKNPSVGFPKFKSKKLHKFSYTTNRVGNNIVIESGYIRLPKVGLVKMKQHRVVPNHYMPKSVTVSKSASDKYYASILFEYETQITPVEPKSFVGLDYSMHELYADSNGNSPCYPRFYRQALEKLAREQRKLSKVQDGQCNSKERNAPLHRSQERSKHDCSVYFSARRSKAQYRRYGRPEPR